MKEIILFRHGDAENFLTHSYDAERPLTEFGKQITHNMAQIIQQKHLSHLDCIISSPYVRAQQTADILRVFWRKALFFTSNLLTPYSEVNDFFSLWDLFENNQLKGLEISSIMIVSHQPYLMDLASTFMPDELQRLPFLPRSGSMSFFVENWGQFKAQLNWVQLPEN